MTTRKYYAHGIQGVEIDGANVPIGDLVTAYKAAEETISKLKAHLATRSRERDEAVKEAGELRNATDAMVKLHTHVEATLREERDAYRDELRREREPNAGRPAERLRESIEELERVPADIDKGDKRMWVVSRTTTVQPGEYGDVFVWAADADGAAWEVLHGGYSRSQPLYGYTDRAHMAVRALDSIFTDDDDDAIVVAETAR